MASKKNTIRKFQVGDIVTTLYTRNQKSRVLTVTKVSEHYMILTTTQAGRDSLVPVGHYFRVDFVSDSKVTLVLPVSKLSKVLA